MLGAHWSGPGEAGVHGDHVRRCGRRRPLAAVVVATIGVAGCSGGSSPTPSTSSSSTTATVSAPTPSPSPSLTPEQQAANEAKAAYANYRKMLDAVFQRGGTNARRDLAKVATNGQLTFLLDEAAEFQREHIHAIGSPTLRNLAVQKVLFDRNKAPQVVLRVCDDATTADAVDQSGRSVREKGTLAHLIGLVTLTRLGGKGWLVTQEQDTPVRSC
jgi:hypothetical protein